MKQTLVLLILILILGCTFQPNATKNNLANVNLIIDAEVTIDSVWISNFNQTESFFLPYQDTIKVNFKSVLNDLYNIEVFTQNGAKYNQLWLDGSGVIISTTLKEKLEIDTVLNSDLYHESVAFSKTFRELTTNNADSLTIDEFLLEKIRENVNSPFSFAVANTFIYRNQNNKKKIKQLFDVLSVQDDTLKSHIISIHSKIENILQVNRLDTNAYRLADINNDVATMALEDSKTYLLDFWFINCPPCVKDHRLIATKQDFLKQHDIELIGISTDKTHVDWKNYLNEHNYNWRNFREIDSLKKITTDMAIWSFPTYLYLDSRGNIKARFNSFSDFESSINQ